jgi:glycosyltransferase involved in cell wall biosynthesis
MIDILHIYAGTSGSAGSYLNEIYKGLSKNFKQEVIVSRHYPFNYGKKVFYKYSDLVNPNIFHKFHKLRLSIRYLELLYSLIFSFIFIKIKKPKIVNYSLTTQINLEKYFLEALKKYTKSKLYITVHDVLPFKNTYSDKDASLKIKKRKYFLNLADKLIIHNKNSFEDLLNHYAIKPSVIVQYPFPIMDIKDIEFFEEKDDNLINTIPKNKYIFSFIGHLRQEKGIDILLKGWEKFNKTYNLENKIVLIIAGNIPKGFEYSFEELENFLLIDKFLNDIEYKTIIEKSDCVILPYTRGTNSGIPSTVISLKTKLITSNIEMFKNNEIIDKNFMFKNDDVNELVKIMEKSINEEYNFYLLEIYKDKFRKNINSVFNKEFKFLTGT